MNKDPYQVLGISPNASEDDIKRAYKELVKKYHPDQYQDNPLSDVAEEKMAEINTAYDEIMQMRRSGGNSYNYGYYRYNWPPCSQKSSYCWTNLYGSNSC